MIYQIRDTSVFVVTIAHRRRAPTPEQLHDEAGVWDAHGAQRPNR
ncbi:MAG: hypothetical protein AB7I32_14245 [Gammaproteobacteria bacterium]